MEMQAIETDIAILVWMWQSTKVLIFYKIKNIMLLINMDNWHALSLRYKNVSEQYMPYANVLYGLRAYPKKKETNYLLGIMLVYYSKYFNFLIIS